MSEGSAFLGIQHTFQALQSAGYVEFWPKQAIIDELRSQMARFKAQRRCSPGDASKFQGVAGFAAEAQFGQLGKAPMRPFMQRQYWDKPPWVLTHTMERSMAFVELLLSLELTRKVRVTPDHRRSLVIASDA